MVRPTRAYVENHSSFWQKDVSILLDFFFPLLLLKELRVNKATGCFQKMQHNQEHYYRAIYSLQIGVGIPDHLLCRIIQKKDLPFQPPAIPKFALKWARKNKVGVKKKKMYTCVCVQCNPPEVFSFWNCQNVSLIP